MLSALDAADVEAMCYERCIDSVLIRTAHGNVETLVGLLRSWSERESRKGSRRGSGRGSGRGSESSGGGSSSSSGASGSGHEFLRRGTG